MFVKTHVNEKYIVVYCRIVQTLAVPGDFMPRGHAVKRRYVYTFAVNKSESKPAEEIDLPFDLADSITYFRLVPLTSWNH